MPTYTITNAQYYNDFDGKKLGVRATVNGKSWHIPLDPENSFYAEILRQVEAGDLTIEDAD